MGNFSLSSKASFDIVSIYKYGIKYFGKDQAQDYLYSLESFLVELSEREELYRDCSTIAKGLKFYAYKAHTIFFIQEEINKIYIVRILGKRMNFIEHL